jgi:hypothetical protein
MNAQDFANKIAARAYASPGRARAAVARSPFKAPVKRKLMELIAGWERNQELADLAPVVAGELPEGGKPDGAVEDAEVVTPPDTVDDRGDESLSLPLRLNLNALVRVKLTLHGMSLLYQHYKQHAPEKVLASGGVWETELWQLCAVIAGAGMGDQPIEKNVVEVLDPRLDYVTKRQAGRVVMEYDYGSAYVAPVEPARGAHP